MTADAWKIYNSAKEFTGDSTIDLDAGDGHFAVALLDSGHTPDLTDSTWSDVSGDEVAAGNGYTAGGVVLSGTAWTRSGGTATFDADDPAWTAAGGSIAARFAVLVHIAAGTGVPQSTDKLMAYCLLDDTPADVTATAGNVLTVQLPAAGFFQVSGGDS